MKRPEEVKREFCRQWLEKADGDLRACRHLLAGGAEHAENVTFHAQQAAEKYLKAFLVWHQVEFPKTHDIARLIELVGSCGEALAAAVADAALLTPYGVEYRYPGEYPEVSLPDAERSAQIAAAVREQVVRHLPLDILG
jgi:HEPN domain-containing protein